MTDVLVTIKKKVQVDETDDRFIVHVGIGKYSIPKKLVSTPEAAAKAALGYSE